MTALWVACEMVCRRSSASSRKTSVDSEPARMNLNAGAGES